MCYGLRQERRSWRIESLITSDGEWQHGISFFLFFHLREWSEHCRTSFTTWGQCLVERFYVLKQKELMEADLQDYGCLPFAFPKYREFNIRVKQFLASSFRKFSRDCTGDFIIIINLSFLLIVKPIKLQWIVWHILSSCPQEACHIPSLVPPYHRFAVLLAFLCN